MTNTADRQRRTQATRTWRARQRAGVAVLRVPVPSFDVVEALIDAERMTVAQALDRRLVEHAAGQVLAEWAARWLARTGDR